MKRIAIFVSGEGEATERVVKLFNEGNRVKTVLVVGDQSAAAVLERLKDRDVTLLQVSDNEWPAKSAEIPSLMKENDIKLIALDNFHLVISDEIMEAVDGEVIRFTSALQAPREVVAALEADLRKPVEEPEPEPQEDETPSLESEWADSLKIRYTPPKVPVTPPEVPEEPGEENISQDISQSQAEGREFNSFRPQDQFFRREPRRYESHVPEDAPMPPTWLIWSVLVTIFCCFIPGIIAIIFSSQVSARYYAGDLEGAKRSSRLAEIWIIVSVVLGVLAATLYIPFMLLGM